MLEMFGSVADPLFQRGRTEFSPSLTMDRPLIGKQHNVLGILEPLYGYNLGGNYVMDIVVHKAQLARGAHLERLVKLTGPHYVMANSEPKFVICAPGQLKGWTRQGYALVAESIP